MLRLLEEHMSGGATTGKGPSAEMRRFSAGIRVVTALLCTVMLLANEPYVGLGALSVLMLYCAWSAYLLWTEASEKSHTVGVWPYWVDEIWSCLTIKLFAAGTMMMVITLVHSVVLDSIDYGVGPDLVLALAAALGLLYDASH